MSDAKRRWTTLWGVILASLLAVPLGAQTIRGSAVDAGDRPVAGVVVLLVDSASRVTARTITDARGDFRLTATSAGTYRLRTLRIGYRPVTSAPVVLSVGDETTQRLQLAGLPVALDAMRVVDRSECRAFADSGAATFAVWEQIRTALLAAQVTEASRSITSTTVLYDRTLDPTNDRVLRQKADVFTGVATRAWRTPPADTLHRTGYVVTRQDNTIDFYAPGLDALLSTVFVQDHCFRLTEDRKQPALLGLAFEPTPERRKGVSEIRGTLWLDRTSSELQRLDVRYVNVTSFQEERAGAQLAFVRMRDGTWAISRWTIRMPVVEQFILRGHGAEDRVTSIQVSGGELALARRDADTLWAEPGHPFRGTIVDSASGRSIAGARVRIAETGMETQSDSRGAFVIDGVVPGLYAIDVRTPSLDSLNTVYPTTLTLTSGDEPRRFEIPNAGQVASAICGATDAARGAVGIIVGRLVTSGDAEPRHAIGGARVIATWAVDSARTQRSETRSTRDGSFRLCHLPLGAAISVRATTDSAESPEPVSVHLSPSARLFRAELPLETLAQLATRGAVFAGTVVFDSTHAPIIGAEVALPDIAKDVLTDEHGSFRITQIPPGEHQIVVRRMGYGAADTRLTFHGNEMVERRVVLGRAVTLEPMVVSERTVDRAMASFEENRRVGLGHFIDRAQLAKLEGVSIGAILEQIPGATILRGNGGAWVRSSRAFSFTGLVPDSEDSFKGAPPAACYSQVYLDNLLVFGGRAIDGHLEPLFNLNSISPAQIEAIEFYASPAETPLKYSNMESHCGVLVIWTRRSP